MECVACGARRTEGEGGGGVVAAAAATVMPTMALLPAVFPAFGGGGALSAIMALLLQRGPATFAGRPIRSAHLRASPALRPSRVQPPPQTLSLLHHTSNGPAIFVHL